MRPPFANFAANFKQTSKNTTTMGGFFGTVSAQPCIADVFYGTDYHSHLGTRRGGIATYDKEEGFKRSIHNLENSYFRTKFEDGLGKFKGNAGIGVISDTDAQPIVINSHLGKFAIATVAKITNLDELEHEALKNHQHFAELSSGKTNQTEVVALLIVQGNSLVDGIENVFRRIKGSCSMLLLTENGIVAARDKLGRTPVVIGRKDGAYAVASETSSFPNLDYKVERYLGPGEIVRIHEGGIEQLRKPNDKMQICSFLWVYYGFPTSSYEGINVEKVRFACGEKMGKTEKGAVWLDPEKTSPFEFFQYWRNVADADVMKCIKMLTFLPLEQIREMESWEGAQLNKAKEILAYELTKLVHGEEEAEKALAAAKELFGGKGVSGDMPTAVMPAELVNDGKIGILDALVASKLCPSKREARTNVTGGGISVNDEKVTDPAAMIEIGEFAVIKKGKKSYCKIVKA